MPSARKSKKKFRPKTLCIIIPVYNEGTILDEFLHQLIDVRMQLRMRVNCVFVFVNNGSNDNSLEILLSKRSELSPYAVLTLTRNFGYETALVAGLTHAEGEIFALCDSDGEDPLNLLVDFLSHIETGYEIAIGIRKKRHESLSIQAFRRFSYFALSKLSDDPFRSHAGNFSMFTLQVKEAILAENRSFPFLRSTFSRTGYRCVEVPHDRSPRIGGKSNYRRLNLVKFAIAGFLTATTFPLRLITYMAITNLALFLCSWILNTFSNFENIASTVKELAVALTVLHVLLSSSVIALYVARIYKESLRRPLFYVDWENSYTTKSHFLNR